MSHFYRANASLRGGGTGDVQKRHRPKRGSDTSSDERGLLGGVLQSHAGPTGLALFAVSWAKAPGEPGEVPQLGHSPQV